MGSAQQYSYAVLWGFRGDTSEMSAPRYAMITGESNPVYFAQMTYAKTFNEACIQKPTAWRSEHRFLVPVRIVELSRIERKGARAEIPVEPSCIQSPAPDLRDISGLTATRSRCYRSRLSLQP